MNTVHGQKIYFVYHVVNFAEVTIKRLRRAVYSEVGSWEMNHRVFRERRIKVEKKNRWPEEDNRMGNSSEDEEVWEARWLGLKSTFDRIRGKNALGGVSGGPSGRSEVRQCLRLLWTCCRLCLCLCSPRGVMQTTPHPIIIHKIAGPSQITVELAKSFIFYVYTKRTAFSNLPLN